MSGVPTKISPIPYENEQTNRGFEKFLAIISPSTILNIDNLSAGSDGKYHISEPYIV